MSPTSVSSNLSFTVLNCLFTVLKGVKAFTIQNIGAIGRGNGSCIYFKIYNYGYASNFETCLGSKSNSEITTFILAKKFSLEKLLKSSISLAQSIGNKIEQRSI